jgi:membrane protein YqaA with SNARE-associated domain
MYALALAATTFVGTFFWPASPEAAVALFATQRAWPALAIGLLAAAGQGLAYLIIYPTGEQIRRRWPWFGRQCQRVQERYGARLTRSGLPLACASGLVGVPPSSALVAVAPGLGLRARWLLPVLLLMRVLRFTFMAAIATRVVG